MKYKTFRALVIAGAVGGLFLAGSLLPDPPPRAGRSDRSDAQPVAPAAPPRAAQEPAEPPPSPAAPSAASPLPPGAAALRPFDHTILAAAARGCPGDKVKDALPGRPWKVNLYRDPGFTAVNRLKLDLNRNEKWDEKWTFLPEGVKRQVAPNDDEVYTEEWWYHPAIAAWSAAKPVGGSDPVSPPATGAVPLGSVPPAAPSLPAGAVAFRPMDAEILAAASRPVSGDKVKDAVPGRAWKVNFYKDAGAPGVNRAKVDLDRDEKWDEKWTWKDGGVLREVAPADDEAYTVKFFAPAGATAWGPR